MAGEMNFTPWPGNNDNSTSFLDDQTGMVDYMEWAIYSYIGIAIVSTLVITCISNWKIAKFSSVNFFLPILDIGTDVRRQ